MDSENKDFWAEKMFGDLGRIPAAELLQKAQDAAQAARHEFYSTQGEDAPLVDLEGEVVELLEAIRCNHSTAHIRNEAGDVIFCLINVCRLHGVSFADAMEKTAERWLTRKSMQERRIREAGYNWETIPLELNDKIWQDIKAELKHLEYRE